MKLEITKVLLTWPRTVAMVARWVGTEAFAARVVSKAYNQEPLYQDLVREAWANRRKRQWKKTA